MNEHPDKLLPAVYGGIIMGLLSSIPFVNLVNCFCCAGVLAGGVFAVFFYKNAFTPDTPPFTVQDCLVVGMMAGIVGAFVGTGLTLLFELLFGNVAREFLASMILNSDIEIPEEARARLEEALEGGDRGVVKYLVNLIVSLIFDGIFGLLGGLIGYSIFKPKAQAPPPMPKPV